MVDKLFILEIVNMVSSFGRTCFVLPLFHHKGAPYISKHRAYSTITNTIVLLPKDIKICPV